MIILFLLAGRPFIFRFAKTKDWKKYEREQQQPNGEIYPFTKTFRQQVYCRHPLFWTN